LHLRGGVKGIIVIAPSLGFGGILLYSIYAQRASLNTIRQFTLFFLSYIVTTPTNANDSKRNYTSTHSQK